MFSHLGRRQFPVCLKIDTMPESRDRLSRPDDITAMFARRRQSIGGIAILLDEPEEVGSGTPFRWGATAMTGTRGAMGSAATRGGGVGRGSLGTPRTRNRRGGAQLKHDISMISPNPTVGMRNSFPPSVGKVPKILLDITNQNVGQPDCLTPQKKFLNSIDTVEKMVMEELKKLMSTPGAKKADREKRVRSLASMRRKW
ncbi:hypothetical protein CsSME_00048350 [Camellia sinensis var. sinensis]